MCHYDNLSFILAVGHILRSTFNSGSCPYQPKFRPTVNCLFPGRCLEIISLFSEWLQARLEVTVIPREAENVWNYPTLDYDPSTNAVALTQSGEVDTTCTFWKDDPNISDVIYTDPVYQLDHVFIVRKQTEAIDIFSTFEVFTPTVWDICLATFFVNAFAFAMVSITEQRLSGAGVKMRDIVDKHSIENRFVLFNQTRQSRYCISNDSNELQLMENELISQTFLLTSLYSGLLLSFLLFETNKLPFEDGNEAANLIESGRYKLLLLRENDVADRIRFSQLPMINKLRDALEVNPP
ncbi:hypothetical protein PMAYCL1PPCAC_31323, partial [Pristionchus mayeri]